VTNLQEIARLVREELLTLIRPVQLMSVNPSKATGEVSGRFKSNGVLFDYSIQGGTVTYRPVGSGGGRSDSADHVVGPDARLDAARGKPRNCTTGYACGNTCIQKGRKCRAKGGAAAAKLEQAVKMLPAAGQTSGEAAPQRKAAPEKKTAAAPAAKTPGKGPSLKEVKSAVLEAFDVKSVAALKADDEYKMSMAGEEANPLKSKEDWLKLYRRFVKVPENERNLPDGPTVVNGIDVIKNFRPWAVFGLDPKKATANDVRSRFRKLIMQHHPDKGGDPRVAERLKKMRDSMLAFMPDDRKAAGRRDAADPVTAGLVQSLRASRRALQRRWSPARADGYREVLVRLDAIGA
jgi:hypothetical protein